MTAYLDAYAYFLQARGLASTSVGHNIKIARVWMAYCTAQGIDPLLVQRPDLLIWFGGLRERMALSTPRVYLVGLRLFYDYLLEEELVTENHARHIRIPRRPLAPVNPFSDADLDSLFASLETPTDLALVLLLLGGGLRRAELVGIRREHVDLKAGTILIHGKGAKRRQIAPGAFTMDAVAALQATSTSAFLFDVSLAPTGRASNGVYLKGVSGNVAGRRRPDRPLTGDWVARRLKALATRAGLEGHVNPHRFRHSFAVRFCEAGGGIDQLQMLLGHSTLEMSMHYSRSGREQRALSSQALLSPANRFAGLHIRHQEQIVSIPGGATS